MGHLQAFLSVATALFLLDGAVTSAQSPAADADVKSRIAELIQRELLLEESNLWRSAIDTSMEILKFDPKSVEAMNTISGLHGKLGEFQEEVTWARKALDVDPRYEPAYINYGNALASLGRSEEARAAYEKARDLAPDDPIPVYSLGVLAENQGKIEQALKLYERSVELDKEFENGYFNKAAMLANLKRFDEAVATLNMLLKLNPELQDAREMLQQIEKERASKPQNP